MQTTRLIGAGLLATLALAIAGCSGGGDGGAPAAKRDLVAEQKARIEGYKATPEAAPHLAFV